MSVKAFVDLEEDPVVLCVCGSATVYRDDDRLEISLDTRAGVSPEVLMLSVKVIEGEAPMKGVVREWGYEERGTHVRDYRRVIVHFPDGGTATVDVSVRKSRF